MTLPLPPLPLLLAGPMLRRVEPTLVCVWVALTEPATLKLKVWEGRAAFNAPNVFIESTPQHQQMVRVGQKLYVGLVALKIDAAAKLLQPSRLYSYDLEIVVGGVTHTLKTLGLLRNGVVGGHPVAALGYDDDSLPHFSLPPAELTDLRIVFGSCRRVANDHADAMVYIDDMMIDHGGIAPPCPHADPLKRPHQLFLGGDQIYADDLSPLHLSFLIDRTRELIGADAQGEVRERLPVNRIRRKKPEVADPASLSDYGDDVLRPPLALPADFLLPADRAYFPPARRYLATTVEAQMTTVDGQSHLFGFGEFAAMYLSVWSNAVWPLLVSPTPASGPALQLPTAAAPGTVPGPDDIRKSVWKSRIPSYIDSPLEGAFIDTPPAGVDSGADPREAGNDISPFQNYPPESKRVADGGLGRSMAGQARQLTTFYLGLAKVRRVLANIPTYMMFDDHDLTDDWNLNPTWMDRVLTAPLGVATMRNGLAAYALFQDWGNDPLRYLGGEPAQVLQRIGQMFPPGTEPGPVEAAAAALDTLFGFGGLARSIAERAQPDGSYDETHPPMKWHFSVPGPKHLAIALDNRTRRSFVSRNGPPGNVALSAQPDQVPAGPFADGKQVLIVIAPLQVLGPPLLDELIAPAAYKMFDLIGFTKDGKARPGLKDGARAMLGTNPDAIEAWAFDAPTMEALLARLAPYGRVLLLSGDVHYSASNAMSYWRKGVAAPARIVQFTSSGLKNVMPPYITLVDRSLPFAQRLIRSGIGAERIGWLTKPANPLLYLAGKTEKDVPRALRAKLRQSPAMVPNHGWPDFVSFNADPPDWSWRVVPLLDQRPDAERPVAEQPLAIDEAAAQAHLDSHADDRVLQAYQAIAARHQRQFEGVRNSRQILFRSNVGLVRFEQRDGALHAVHEAYSAFRPATDLGTDPPIPAAFFRHSATLDGVASEPRPESGRNARLDLG